MNTNNLTIYKIPAYSDAWYRFRATGLIKEDCDKYKCPPYVGGIGASETGSILGLTKKYRPCPAETYHYKIGDITPAQNTNRAMLRGKILEPIVKTIWELYNGENDSWIDSYEEYQNGDRTTRDMLSIRRARKYNAYFVNNDYPWLFSSLDYFAEKGTLGLLPDANGKPIVHHEGFPVEIKTVNKNYAQLWEAGCPPSHICQLNQEMICTNSTYGEIAVLFPDDFSFRIFPFNKDEELCARILHWTKVFWDKVLQSREAKKAMDQYYQLGNMEKGDEMQSIIDSNEPEPDDGEAYLSYIKEKYQPGMFESIEGDISLFYDTMEYKLASGVSDLLDDKQRGIKNKIMKILTDNKVQQITFGEMGKITYMPDKNGDRSLRFSTKPIFPVKSRSEEEYKKIGFDFGQ